MDKCYSGIGAWEITLLKATEGYLTRVVLLLSKMRRYLFIAIPAGEFCLLSGVGHMAHHANSGIVAEAVHEIWKPYMRFVPTLGRATMR